MPLRYLPSNTRFRRRRWIPSKTPAPVTGTYFLDLIEWTAKSAPLLRWNDMEGQTDEASVTVAASDDYGGDFALGVTIGTDATMVYDSARAANQAMSIRLKQNASSTLFNASKIWLQTLTFESNFMYGRCYFYIPDGTPGQQNRLISWYDDDSELGKICDVVLDTDGTIRLRATGSVNIDATTSGFIADGTWLRIEHYFHKDSGDNEVRLFKGANYRGEVPDDILVGNTGVEVAIGRFYAGFFDATISGVDNIMWVDGIAIALGWPGP